MMSWSLANACVVILGVWTGATHSAAVHDDTVRVPSAVMTQLVEMTESLCNAMPDLVGCDAVNDTLLQVQQEESGRVDVPSEYNMAASKPLLSLALNRFSSIQLQNRELMERDALNVARLAALNNEKARLEERLIMLEGRQEYVRTTRSTQIRQHSPPEASNNLETLYNPSRRGQTHQAANVLRPNDCSDYLVMGYNTSGVYQIYPFRCRCSKPVSVWCDMETDGGGWTVFLARRNDTSREDFNRNWSDYRNGFGNASGEYWLGNDNLFAMTTSRAYRLRLDFITTDGNRKWGEWPAFRVLGEDTKYKLQASNYNANSMIDNCITPQNNRLFSTFDVDNDGTTSKNCAQVKKGGWWYSSCSAMDPTVQHAADGSLKINCPYKVQNTKVPLVGYWMQMKIRPTICDIHTKSVYFNGYSCHDHNLQG
ncbi:angiopoietin-related protein 7-like [Panulirus ornatus]|uniref:angiopoietin-related protein 7-like n=1 Tax=Panulirus ornatus TaxID=150431 RepID=UPI003A8710DC